MNTGRLLRKLPFFVALVIIAAMVELVTGRVVPQETGPWDPWTTTSFMVPDKVIISAMSSVSTPTIVDDHHRRNLAGTICGYIGANPTMPATCMVGSHCAVNIEHSAVGCCPDHGHCSHDIFTGCVDKNSGPQTVMDPYVYTCTDNMVCYRNEFDGGYFQFGCGSVSGLATYVATSATGLKPVRHSVMTDALTATPIPLPAPTIIGSNSSQLGGNEAEAVPGKISPLGDAGPTPSAAPRDPEFDRADSSTAAIVGGTIGAIALLAAFVAVVVVVRRRKRGRQLPNSSPARSMIYMRPLYIQAGNVRDAPPSLSSSRSRLTGAQNSQNDGSPDGEAEADGSGDSDAAPGTGAGSDLGPRIDVRGGTRLVDEMEGLIPGLNLTSESQREDEGGAQEPVVDHMATYPGPRRHGGGVLWQQNRKRSRNPMWI